MAESYLLIWIADGHEPTPTDLALMDWKHPPEGPLRNMQAVIDYLVTATWPDGYKPWVRKPDGSVLNPLEVIGYLPE